MTSAADEKCRPFNCFFSRVGLRNYQPFVQGEEILFELGDLSLAMMDLLIKVQCDVIV